MPVVPPPPLLPTAFFLLAMDPNSPAKRPSRGGRGSGGGRGEGTRMRSRTVATGRGQDSYGTLATLVSRATKPTKETGYKHLDEVSIL